MDDSTKERIERACERLIVAYTHLIDFGDGGRVGELFSPDGVWESEQTRMEGRDEITRGFGRRQQRADRISRHVCTNTAINAIDENSAEGVTYFTLYRRDGVTALPAGIDGPTIVGQYRDRFVRTAEGWRFAHRRAEAAFVRERARPGVADEKR